VDRPQEPHVLRDVDTVTGRRRALVTVLVVVP
jgi:hypothetical protein